MSCSAPIDISSRPSGKCDLKCDYKFDYPDSNIVVTNAGTHLSLNYDRGTMPPVLYNADAYNVQEVRFYTPSLHRYLGREAPAELVIYHSYAGKNLVVCVPLIVGSSSTKTAKFFTQLVDYVNTFAQNASESANMGNVVWTINDWIPLKKFYSYTGTELTSCSGKYDYIVFSVNDAATATISQDSLTNLQSLISRSNAPIVNNKFYESTVPAIYGLGPGGEDEIYISCSPTGSSDEMELVGVKDSNRNYFADFGSYMKEQNIIQNPFFQSLLAILAMIGVYKLGKFVFKRKTKE